MDDNRLHEGIPRPIREAFSGAAAGDGVINEGRLGHNVIYAQAKRWQNTVGRKEIQSFIGALAGQQADKGVFIMSSEFAEIARQFVKTIAQNIILIDGERLAELMIEHSIGVSRSHD
jgi:restriction system protein